MFCSDSTGHTRSVTSGDVGGYRLAVVGRTGSTVAIQPIAVELMRAMDGQSDHHGLSEVTGIEPRVVMEVCEALRRLGAVGSG